MSWNIRTMKWALDGLGIDMTKTSRLPDEGVRMRYVNDVKSLGP